MDIHGIPIKSVWTFITWLPGFILRRFFPKERLAALIYIDVRARHDSVTINLAQSASYQIWLTLINLSPFEVELDRAEFCFAYGGMGVKSSILKKQKFAPGEIATLYLSEVIPDGLAQQMATSHENNSNFSGGLLEGFIEFNCKLQPFRKDGFTLSGIRPYVINSNYRTMTQTH